MYIETGTGLDSSGEKDDGHLAIGFKLKKNATP
jgi:hypothetical protein